MAAANNVYTWDIINGISAGLCLLDKDFRILWVNKHQADWVGLPQDVCGKKCYKIFEHRNHICRGCPTLKVFRTGQVQTAKRIGFTKEGKKRYYHLTVSPIKDNCNRVMFALELIQDITDSVLRQRRELKITHKFILMQQHLSAVNKKLRHNIYKLKDIAQHMAGLKTELKEKYLQKANGLRVIKKQLQDLFKVNHALSATVDLRKISSLITRSVCQQMHTDACILRLLDATKKTLMANSVFSLRDVPIEPPIIIKVGDGISGKVAESGKYTVVYDIDKDQRLKAQELLKPDGIKSILSVPVVSSGKVLGVITTYSKKPHYFNEEAVEILKIFASHISIAVQEAKHYEDIHMTYFNTIHALVLALESRDPYTRGHTERVTQYALEVGRALHLPPEELELLRYACEVHDIGKISIPDFILNKPGRLSPSERAIIEMHPIKSAEILEPLEFLKTVIPIVQHHHERYDGTGYPDGLSRQKIPFMSKILSCADSFDAMTSERPYRRRKLSVEEALVEIKNNSGSQFDPRIAGLFVKTISTYAPNKALT